MSQDLTIAALQGQKMAGAFAALDPEQDSLSDGIGAGYGVIGYKGKVWTLRHRGEKHTFVRPDDGTPSAFLDVIILRNVAYKSKSYYPEGSFQDVGSDGKRPMCSALDGITPDPDAQEKQATACAICPRNEWKTGTDGRKGRECTDYKRLAVLILPSISARLYPNGQPLMEPVFLRVPAGSLTELGTYGDNLKGQGFHYSAVVTRIQFDPQAPHPKMLFKAIQALSDKEAPVVMPLRLEPLAQRITGESEVGKPRPQQAQIAGVAPSQTVLGQTAPTQPATVVGPQTANAVAVAPPPPNDRPSMAGFVDSHGVTIDVTPNKPAPVVTAAVNPPPAEPDAVDTGFGLVGQNPSNVVQLNGAADKNTEADVGAPGEADVDLDARIAAKLNGLLPTA